VPSGGPAQRFHPQHLLEETLEQRRHIPQPQRVTQQQVICRHQVRMRGTRTARIGLSQGTQAAVWRRIGMTDDDENVALHGGHADARQTRFHGRSRSAF